MNSGKAPKSSIIRITQNNINKLLSLVIAIFIAIFSFLIHDLYKSANELSVSFIRETEIDFQETVQAYINDINHLISNNSTIRYKNAADILNRQLNNQHYSPSLTYFESVNSIVVASTNGDSYMLHRQKEEWMNRITQITGDTTEEVHQFWKGVSTDNKDFSMNTDTTVYDPRVRPWYKGVIKQEPNTIFWTDPYKLHTDKKYGITASTYSLANNGDTIVTAYDILLTNFNKLTQSIELTPNSYALVVTADNYRVVGLSNNKRFNNSDSTSEYLLRNIRYLNMFALNKGIKRWLDNNKSFSPTEVKVGSKHWWMGIQPILSDDNKELFYVIMMVPEADFRATMNQTLNITSVSFVIIIVLLFFITSAFKKINAQNRLLLKKRIRIARQKEFIEQRNKEILDSIHYTKAIQASMLPKDDQLINAFSDHFIMYHPKDIVSGDLYWHETFDGCQMIAAIDCTGHGVPGAVLSMISYGGLKSALLSNNLIQPNKILEHLNAVVTSYFLNKTKYVINDGMDIAFTTYYPKDSLIQYAGAKNPIFIVRNNTNPLMVNNQPLVPVLTDNNRCLYVIKADRKGVEPSSESVRFTCNNIIVENDDCVYLFTDGYADQFGGEKGKKINMKRFKELLLSVAEHDSMFKQKEHLQNFFFKWKGTEEQVDDVLILGYRI
nr:SpoIIE family protein phosphatase [uncultured Carboxylicivirga sp.]